MSKPLDSLGEVRHTFKPKMANIFAGVIIGLLLIVGGLSLAIFLTVREDPKPLDDKNRIAKYAFIAALGIVAPIGGVALLVRMKSFLTHRVTLHDEGFRYALGRRDDAYLWSDVRKISEIFTHEQLKVLKVPGASLRNIDQRLQISVRNGKDCGFTVNSIDDVPRFAQCLKAISEKRSIPWERIEA
jgi:predicted Zn-ribbon and HTH transcriptional regulator